MTDFDASVLVNNLPAFSDDQEDLCADIQRYRSYYGIDFSDLTCHQQLGSIAVAGFNIAVDRFTPKQSRGQAFLVHGYHDHHGLYGHVIRFLLEQHFTVTTFDLPGHGLSSGERGTIADFDLYQQVLEQVLETLPATRGPIHLIGQSTGAAILNYYLLSRRPEPSGVVVMLAPLVRPAKWPWVKFAHNLLRPWVKAIPRQFTENSNDPVFLDFLEHKDPLQARTITVQWVSALRNWIPQFNKMAAADNYNTLIVQGKQDETVDWRYNLEVIEKKFTNTKTLLLPKGRHHLANESASIRQQYFEWLESHL